MEDTSGRLLLDPFGQAQEKGLQFGQTWSRAIIACNSVPPDRIENVVSVQGDKNFISESFHASSSSEDGSQRRLAIAAAATGAVAWHTIKLRRKCH